MPVSENETALSRGRVPTYMRRQLNDLMAVLLRSNSSRLRVATLTFFLFDEDILVHLHRRRRRHRDIISSLFMVMQNHYTSYDMVVRPTVLFSRSNWLYLKSLWDLQVLFYNLFTCAQGHGNPCNYILGVTPPTVEEYLYSANNNLLVPLIIHDDEDDHFENENAENEALYYHIIFNNNPNNFN